LAKTKRDDNTKARYVKWKKHTALSSKSQEDCLSAKYNGRHVKHTRTPLLTSDTSFFYRITKQHWNFIIM